MFWQDLKLSIRLAVRELRQGLSGFRIFLLCLFLGVLTISAIGSLSSTLVAGLGQRGQEILGGDLDLRLMHRAARADELAALQELGSVSHVSMTRVMVRASDTMPALLAEAKAIDLAYPLIGRIEFQPRMDASGAAYAALAYNGKLDGVLVEPDLLDRLQVDVGDPIYLGELQVQIRGVISAEPDRLAGGFALGPRIMVSHDALMKSGLNQAGSLVQNHYRVLVRDPEISLDYVREALETQFPLAGWRIRDRRDASPSVRRTIERVALFLTLVGLTALTVGGVGVGNAISAYLDRRRNSITIFKCLGASERLVALTYAVQIFVLATLAIIAALIFGALAPRLVATLLAEFLQIPASYTVDGKPLLAAAAFGYLTAFGFTLLPLGRAAQTSPAQLFRSLLADAPIQLPMAYRICLGICMLSLAGLCIAISERADIAIWFIAGLGASYGVLRFAAKLLKLTAPILAQVSNFIWRSAMRNIFRPGATVESVVLSVGLSVALITTLAMVEGNISRQIKDDFSGQAPSFFAIDIQPADHDAFVKFVGEQAGFKEIKSLPMLRGAVLKLGDRPVSEVEAPASIAWFLRGDRGLTYSANIPANSEVVDGDWWSSNYEGPPLVSMDIEIATGLGLGVGDTITVNLLGREMEAEIASLRKIDWASGDMNFALVYSPSPLRSAPHSFMSTITMDADSERGFATLMSQRYSSVTLIRVKEAIELVSSLLGQFNRAIWVLSLVTIGASLLVLAGALASGRRARLYDATILKTLGADRRRILTIFLAEYAFIGGFSSLLAGVIGCLASWALIAGAMQSDWQFLPDVFVLSVVASLGLTLLLAATGLWYQLAASSRETLRNN